MTALDDVTLSVSGGTIHGLLGENGAGKSTLMRILYGMTPPDSGRILIDGNPVRLRGPRDALARGIGMVHQHFMLVPELSVLENVILGMEPSTGGLIDRRRAARRIRECAPEASRDLDLDRQARDLTPGEQQQIEILKLLYRDARLLILDEPTAVLSPVESKRLFEEMRRLAALGRTIILISHKLPEVLAITDHVSVLRQGRLISSRPTNLAGVSQLAEEIVGQKSPGAGEIEGSRDLVAHPRRRHAEGVAPILQIEEATIPGPGGRGGLRGLTLDVYPGEILAVAAVEGNGASELARLVAGRLVPASGTVRYRGETVTAGGRAGRGAGGRLSFASPAIVGYIPEDRHKDALVLPMSLARNLVLGRQSEARFRKGVWLDEPGIAAHAVRLAEGHDIRPRDPARPAAFLSGGNQQKAVVARELEENPPIVVAAHPTRGLDLLATSAVHDHLRARRDAGAAVLLFTAELEEARLLGDRMVVLFEGCVAGEVDPLSATDVEIGLLMTGGVPARGAVPAPGGAGA